MTQPKYKVKRGDTVQVITGRNKGQRGTVKKVLLNEAQVVIEGVNVVVRNVKPDYRHPEGSYAKTMPIHISNVSLVDPETDRPAKVGYKLNEDGTKVRYFKKSGTVL